MADFFGLEVKVSLVSGALVRGTVQNVDQKTQRLTLSSAVVQNGKLNQQFDIFYISGNDIKDLQLSSNNKPPLQLPDQIHKQSKPATFSIPNQSFNDVNPDLINHSFQQSNNFISQSDSTAFPGMTQVLNSVHDTSSSTNYLQKNLVSNHKTVQHKTSNYSHPYGDPAIISMEYQQPSPPIPILSRTISQRSSNILAHGLKENEEEGNSTEELEYDDFVQQYQSQQQQQQPPKNKQKKNLKKKNNIVDNSNSNFAHAYEPLIPEKKSEKGKSNKQQYGNNQAKQKKRGNEWANNDVSDYVQEFDFQANLAEFDKKQVFDEISREDQTEPETLLVNLNKKRPATLKNQQNYVKTVPKLGIREMVLDTPSGDETGNEAEVEESFSFESDHDFNNGNLVRRRSNVIRRPYLTTLSDISVPTLSFSELDTMDRISVSTTGPNPDQQIENAARCCAMLVMQAIGGSRRFKVGNHNAPPIIVVLAGECRAGGYGIATARQLANHDCNVIVCWVGGYGDGDGVQSIEGQNITPQLEILNASGAKLVQSAAELPITSNHPVDLVIDGLLGGRRSIKSISSEGGRKYRIVEAIRWAMSTSAPKLSLEAPSGSKGFNLQESPLHISPKYTLAFGLPLTLCYTFPDVGEIFLADIGIPKKLIEKILENCKEEEEEEDDSSTQALTEEKKKEKIKYFMPFADKFLVGLSKSVL
ncbi:enhancer of mRNA decapping [Lobulomyces angularis]|nr:enhancer of mRNA decapping [Lobulomyces angularis]